MVPKPGNTLAEECAGYGLLSRSRSYWDQQEKEERLDVQVGALHRSRWADQVQTEAEWRTQNCRRMPSSQSYSAERTHSRDWSFRMCTRELFMLALATRSWSYATFLGDKKQKGGHESCSTMQGLQAVWGWPLCNAEVGTSSQGTCNLQCTIRQDRHRLLWALDC